MDFNKQREKSSSQPFKFIGLVVIAIFLFSVGEVNARDGVHEQVIPILGVTMEKGVSGIIIYAHLSFESRADHDGLRLEFKGTPGRFSTSTQSAIEEGIFRVAHSLNILTDSWTIKLSVLSRGIVISGESCTAMIALSIVALSKGESIRPDRVMTGVVLSDGRIGSVSSVSLKVAAASQAYFVRVVVPEVDEHESNLDPPVHLEIYPVATVMEAYRALTESLPQSITFHAQQGTVGSRHMELTAD